MTEQQSWARTERDAYCDTALRLGPDQPTLCTGWTVRDLTAHLVLRERRPDAALGIVVKALAPRTERLQAQLAAGTPFERLVEQVRRPPLWSLAGLGAVDRLVNTVEYFIHLEDVRRAQPDWSPRTLPPGLAATLFNRLRTTGKLALRRFPAPVTVDSPGYGGFTVGGPGGQPVQLSGDPGELTLFLSGRQQAAQVELTGPPDLVDRLRGASLGF